jgi:RecJ-like exonuclease
VETSGARKGFSFREADMPDNDNLSPGDEGPAGAAGTGENLCPDCNGSGRVEAGQCPTCDGTGKVIEGIGGG